MTCGGLEGRKHQCWSLSDAEGLLPTQRLDASTGWPPAHQRALHSGRFATCESLPVNQRTSSFSGSVSTSSFMRRSRMGRSDSCKAQWSGWQRVVEQYLQKFQIDRTARSRMGAATDATATHLNAPHRIAPPHNWPHTTFTTSPWFACLQGAHLAGRHARALVAVLLQEFLLVWGKSEKKGLKPIGNKQCMQYCSWNSSSSGEMEHSTINETRQRAEAS